MKLCTLLENLDNIPDGETRKLGSSSGGQGVPSGGTTGQILTKKSDTDYDTEWANINGQVLYDNTTGTNETVTLSDSAANYDYIDIFYRDNDNTYSSVRVNNPNGKYADISTIERWGTTLYIKQKRITISGNTITNENATEAYFTTAPKIGITTTANNIYITKVIGYHDTPKLVDTIPMSNVYYKPGDTLEYTNVEVILCGQVSNATKNLYFCLFTPKMLNNISTVTINILKANTRISGGGYLDGKSFTSGGYDYKSLYNCSATKMTDNCIWFNVGKSSAFSNTTNNIPASVTIHNLKLTFN